MVCPPGRTDLEEMAVAAGPPWPVPLERALKKSDLARVSIDTTVQPKNLAFPTDSSCLRWQSASLANWPRRMMCIYIAMIKLMTHRLT
jgi:hypothetical protein